MGRQHTSIAQNHISWMTSTQKKVTPSSDLWYINWLQFNIKDDFIHFAWPEENIEFVQCIERERENY